MADERTLPRSKKIEELIFIKIPHIVAGLLFIAAVTINIVNVIGRYVFSYPLFWAEEVLVFIVIWAVFLLAGSITYSGGHLAMDLFYSAFSPLWKRIVNIVIALSLIGCSLLTVVQSWKVIGLHIRNGGVTAATDIPLAYPHSAILFGFLFIAAAAIVRIRAYITGKFD